MTATTLGGAIFVKQCLVGGEGVVHTRRSVLTSKVCSRCMVEKPFSEFAKNRSRANGVATYCKSCTREYYLNYVEPPKGDCLVKDCGAPARRRGCCPKHYQQWCKGKLVVDGLPSRSSRLCAIDGCDSPISGRGWCNRHYQRWRKYGDPMGKPPDPPAFCSVEGCHAPVGRGNFVGHGLCSKHYQRWKNHGDPLGGRPSPKVRVSVVSPDGMKSCTQCEKELPLESFHTDASGHGGLRSTCKDCLSARMKEWYAKNQVRQRDRQRVRFATNIDIIRERDMLRYRRNREARLQLAIDATHRRRARLKGADRADRGITYKALRERDGSNCYHCGEEMSFKSKKFGEYQPRRATIEHIIPIARGGLHIWENVALACWECNIRRGARDLPTTAQERPPKAGQWEPPEMPRRNTWPISQATADRGAGDPLLTQRRMAESAFFRGCNPNVLVDGVAGGPLPPDDGRVP